MIEFQNVKNVYENGSRGLDGISFKINKSEFVFFMGENGSGKSSFFKLLIKEIEPSYGTMLIDGKDVTKVKHSQIPYLRRKIGVVFQDFRLLPNKTVYDNVAFAMQIVGASQREIRRSVPMVLSLVGIEKNARKYPDQLSGGEKQRVALARAIINNPPILLADEPTGSLDPETSWEIMDLFNQINYRGTTVVVATHADNIVKTMKKRIIVLHDGKLARDVPGGYNNEL